MNTPRTAKQVMKDHESTTFDGLALMSVEDIQKVIDENIKPLQDKLDNLDQLKANSEGVAGLHCNGDVATWEELENNWL